MILINGVGQRSLWGFVYECGHAAVNFAYMCDMLDGDAISRNIYLSATNCILDIETEDRFPSCWEEIMFYLVRALVMYFTEFTEFAEYYSITVLRGALNTLL